MGFFAWHKLGKRSFSQQFFPIGCTAVCCCDGCTEGYGITPASGECTYFPLSEDSCCPSENSGNPNSDPPTGDLTGDGSGNFIFEGCCPTEYVVIWPPPPNNPFPNQSGPFPATGAAPGDSYIGEYNKTLQCDVWFGINDQNGNVNWIECDDIFACTGPGTGCQPAENGPLSQRITFGCNPRQEWGTYRQNTPNYISERYKDPAFSWQATPRYYKLPKRNFPENIQWQKIVPGQWHTLAIDSQSRLWGWGSPAYIYGATGGEGQFQTNSVPVQLSWVGAGTTGWVDIAPLAKGSIAIKDDTTLHSRGLGGSALPLLVASPYGGLSGSIPPNVTDKWVQISTGYYFGAGIREYNGERTLWTWGRNWKTSLSPDTVGAGNLGHEGGNITSYISELLNERVYSRYALYPWQVGTDTDWLKVTCGQEHIVGIKRDGTLWAFGNNSSKQCGQERDDPDAFGNYWEDVPKQIEKEDTWVDVYANAGSTYAVKRVEGTLYHYEIGALIADGRFWQAPYDDTRFSSSPTLIEWAGAYKTNTNNGGLKSIAVSRNGFHGISGDNRRFFAGMPAGNPGAIGGFGSAPLLGACYTGSNVWGAECGTNPYGGWTAGFFEVFGCGNGVTGFERLYTHPLSYAVFGTKNSNFDAWAWGYNGQGNGGVGSRAPALYCPTKLGGNIITHFGQDVLCFRHKIPSNTPTRTIVLSGYNRYKYTGYLSGDPVGQFMQDGGATMNSLIFSPGASGISSIEGSMGRSFPLPDDVLTYPLWGASGDYGTGSCECQSQWDDLMGITANTEQGLTDYCIGNCLDVQKNDATGHYLPMSNLNGGYHSFSGFQPYVKYWEGVSDTLIAEDNGAYDNAYAVGTGIPTCSLYSLILALYDKTWRYNAQFAGNCNSEADFASGNCNSGWVTPFNNLRNKMLQVLSANPGSVTGPNNESAVTWWLNEFNNEIVSFYLNTANTIDLSTTGYGAFTIPKMILWDRASYLAASNNTDKWKHLYIPGSANILFDSGCTHTNGNWRAHRIVFDEGSHDITWGSKNAARLIQFRACNNASTSVLSETCVSGMIYNPTSSFCTECATGSQPFNMDPGSTNDCFTGPRPELWGDSTVGTNYDDVNN